MSLLSYSKRLFSLDTLDTRFTGSSRPPSTASSSEKSQQIDPAKPVPGLDIQDGTSRGGQPQGRDTDTPGPSKWATPKFFFYYIVIGTAVPLMIKSVYDVSQPSHPTYSQYEHLLSPGWIPGRKVDNSDQQYSGFRDNLPYMLLLLIVHPLLRTFYNSFYSDDRRKNQPLQKSDQPDLQADARLDRRVRFDVGLSSLYLLALHGTSALKVLVILYANFTIAKGLPRSYVPLATWVFNIGILFANELCNGYPYAGIAQLLGAGNGALGALSDQKAPQNWGALLDSYGGLLARWEILFNITVLRLISFNLDYCWSLNRLGGSPLEKKQLDQSMLSERNRVDIPAKSEDYSFRNYFAYVLYSPLYLTGPILTFNDFISQLRYTPRSISRDRTTLYAIRFLFSLLTMEVMLHYLYAVAVSKSQPAWNVYTPFQFSMLGYFSLHHIWLKLLLPWRFFRLWALLDGIDPPENMVRCMSDNYSALAFWRGWHRSFNRWIVRYIYIPLGGSGGPGTRGSGGKARAVFNMLVVFTFVALWHDIQLKLLIWGWLVTLFVLPEVLAGYAFPKRRWKDNPEAYRMICGVGAVGNILMMIAANLVGFAVGLDGLRDLVRGILGSYSGLVFLAAASIALFVAAQVMFELREHELRQGIRCLDGRVCRLAATHLSENVWITDDILKHAWNRWVQSCFGQRYGSAIPGPMEARKRSTKRRMTELRPTASGLDFHPGFLAGLNQEQDSQHGWQWQPHTALTICDPAMADAVALPPWLMASDAAEEEAHPVELPFNQSHVANAIREASVVALSAAPELEQRPRQNLVEQAACTEDLDEMRRLIGKIRMEKYALRRKCSIVAFENLVRCGCPMDRILEFLGDRNLNQRGARNLTFFVAYCLETKKCDEMRILCKWMAQQLYVGRYSDSALLLVLQSLSNIQKQGEWQSVLEDFCVNTVQALQSSPVVRTEYLKARTWSSFLGILFHDVYSERLLSVGLTFVKTSSPLQLDHLTRKIWPLLEHMMDSWEPSKNVRLDPATLTPTITTLLQMLPQDKLCETVTAISWRLLHSLSSMKDIRALWLRQSIWWSAVRSPAIFGCVGKTDAWSAIAAILGKKRDEYIVSIAVTKIDEQLKHGDLGAAHTIMLQCPDMTYDIYPDLAEALILNSERDAKTALEMLQNRRPAALTEVRRVCESRPLEHIRLERVGLLERLSSLYAQAPHIKPSFAFRCVYECWKLHKEDNLGPVRPAMARALIQSGIVRPLQTGRRLVSHARFEWILLQVAEAEGKDVMRKIGAAVWQWREEVIRQMQEQRTEKRQDALGRQWQRQGATQQDLSRWDTLRVMASAGTLPATKHPHSVEYDYPSDAKRDVASPSFRLKLRGPAIKGSVEQSIPPSSPQAASPSDPADEGVDEENSEIQQSTWITLDTATSATSVTSESAKMSNGYVEYYASGYKPEEQSIDRRLGHIAPDTLETAHPPRATLGNETWPPQSSSRLASPADAYRGETEQQHHQPAHGADRLLTRLNRAPLAGCVATSSDPRCSSPSTATRPELPHIPACSLAAAVEFRSTTTDPAAPSAGQNLEKRLVIRRVVGTGVIHGANGGEDPMTLSTALQPAVGTGVGVVVGGSGLEGFAR
ncbi:MAG: hypothetical protein L6R35_005747 [Caloplaca aegaea]|nr:MAG: hypothetical protein L6R35_005747 [Caloplaca aegaea]